MAETLLKKYLTRAEREGEIVDVESVIEMKVRMAGLGVLINKLNLIIDKLTSCPSSDERLRLVVDLVRQMPFRQGIADKITNIHSEASVNTLARRFSRAINNDFNLSHERIDDVIRYIKRVVTAKSFGRLELISALWIAEILYLGSQRSPNVDRPRV